MVLDIFYYGHPVLREKGKRIDRVTPELRKLAADMIETLPAVEASGLAAHQVGQALMLTVLDISASERPWTMTPALPMPLVLINPQILNSTGRQEYSEGCISIPEVYGRVPRTEKLTVQARTLDEKDITFECTGLLAHVIQHEVDHLNGILFVDRMDAATKASVAGKLKRLQKETEEMLAKQSRPRRFLARK